MLDIMVKNDLQDLPLTNSQNLPHHIHRLTCEIQSLPKLLKKIRFSSSALPPSPLQCWFHVRLRISDGLTNVASAIFFISGGPCFEPTLFRGAEGAGKNVARDFLECIFDALSGKKLAI